MLENLEGTMEEITQFLSQFLTPEGETTGFFALLGALGLAYVGGVLSSLTPCIYPMIPITVGVIGGTAGGDRHPWKLLVVRSSVYISGMAIVYAFLGVLAGLTGQVFGTLTNTHGWYLTIGFVITLAALIMMDVIHFDPQALWAHLRHRLGFRSKPAEFPSKELSLLGVFSLGASSGFIAAPCTTPVMATLLAYIAKTQSVGLGLSLMFFFALGLGTILVLIAFFTGLIQFLPKSGMWMKRVKVASGILLLLFAQYLIYQAGRSGGPS